MDATENIIAHQVNCLGAFNSGVAKSIRECFPEVFKDYKEFVDKTKDTNSLYNLLGVAQIIPLRDGQKKYVANLFGQYNYGYDGKQYTHNIKLSSALKSLSDFAKRYNLSVALPYRIGSDRGGADWRDIEEIILEAFDDYEVTLYKL